MTNENHGIKTWADCDSDHNWDGCNHKFTCEDGEDCWYLSEDYKKHMDV